MKRIIYILGILILSLMFIANTCDSGTSKEIQNLKIGDKFTYQEYINVDIARADKDVVIYRLWTHMRYHYYSTTRKDSVIYSIHSNVNR